MLVLDPLPAPANVATTSPADARGHQDRAASSAAGGGSFGALLARCGAGNPETEVRPDGSGDQTTSGEVGPAGDACSAVPADTKPASRQVSESMLAFMPPFLMAGGLLAGEGAAVADQTTMMPDQADQPAETAAGGVLATEPTAADSAAGAGDVVEAVLAADTAATAATVTGFAGCAPVIGVGSGDGASAAAEPAATPPWPAAGGAPYAFARPTRDPIAAAYRPWSNANAAGVALPADDQPGSANASQPAATPTQRTAVASSPPPTAPGLPPTADQAATAAAPAPRPAVAQPMAPPTVGVLGTEAEAASGTSTSDSVTPTPATPAANPSATTATDGETVDDETTAAATDPQGAAGSWSSAAAGGASAGQNQGGSGSSPDHQGAQTDPGAPADGQAPAVPAGSSALLKGLAAAAASTANAAGHGEAPLGPSIRAQVLAEIAGQSVGSTGHEKITLHLEPAHLGKVQVQLQASGTHLEVVVQAQSAEAEKALADGAKELVAAIVGRGEGRWQSVEVRVERSSDDREERSSRDDRQDRGEQRGDNQQDRRRDQRPDR